MNNFESVDITHKPRRHQYDNLNGARKATSLEDYIDEIPQSITIEKAIKYYESVAEKDTKLALLYMQTAKWLREHMNKSTNSQFNQLRNNVGEIVKQEGEEKDVNALT